jgi:hypothetical protein
MMSKKRYLITILLALNTYTAVLSSEKKDSDELIRSKIDHANTYYCERYKALETGQKELSLWESSLLQHFKKFKSFVGPNKKFLEEEYALLEDKTLHTQGFALFSGPDLISNAVKLDTHSAYSHVGTIYVDQNGQQFLVEATGSVPQMLEGIYPQTQVHKLEDVVSTYEGGVSTRAIIFPSGFKEDTAAIHDFIFKFLGTMYETEFSQLLKSPSASNAEDDIKRGVFCSQLTALGCLQLGYFNQKYRNGIGANFTPRDFSKIELLPWTQGIQVSDETIVKPLKNAVSDMIVVKTEKE